MYIEPNTNIIILKNVPLDTTYKHTLYFSSESSQISYFKSMKKYELPKQTYQRVHKGKARVNIKAENLYDCNYIMFQNSSFGSKWFYAFITSVEYINNVVSEITFEIDVIQTWFFDFEIKKCFVEREHSTTDNIGDNIVAEPVATGEYVLEDYKVVYDLSEMCVILEIVDTDKISEGYVYNNIFSGSQLWVFRLDDVQGINDKIASYKQSPDSIHSMYMLPINMFKRLLIQNGGTRITNDNIDMLSMSGMEVELSSINKSTKIGNYLPKNKKLLTYPYNYLQIDNASGNSLSLRYELFNEPLKPTVKIEGTFTQPVKIVCRPLYYKGSPELTVGDVADGKKSVALNTECVSLEGYPICSWNVDMYHAWVAQSMPMVLGEISKFGMASLGSLSSGNPIGSVASGLSSVSNILTQSIQASISADICKGTANNGNVNVSCGTQNFYSGRVHVTEQYAKIIDDFFTMYGYQTNRVKTPNISARPHWNYIKTNDCVIEGSVPCDDMNKICSIFDGGITFWKKGSEVGDYSLDNSI